MEPAEYGEGSTGVGNFFSSFFRRNQRKPSPIQTTDVAAFGTPSAASEYSSPYWASDLSDGDTEINASNVYMVDVAEGRSLPNVLKRISNLLVLKSNTLQAYSDSDLKTYWMPDSVSKECYECCEKFTTFRRRHHCRVCGQIFCSTCCNQQIPGKIFGCSGDLRVCTYCSKVVLSYLQSSDIGSELTADLKALQENLQIKYGFPDKGRAKPPHNQSVTPHAESSGSVMSATLRRKISVGYQEEKFASGRSPTVTYLTPEEKCRALQHSTSLRNLYDEMLKPSGITLRTHWYRLRAYQDCLLGSELVDWLIYQQKASSRVQASAICQALLDGGYFDSYADSDIFIDGNAYYRPGPLVLSPKVVAEADLEDTNIMEEPFWMRNIPQESASTDSDTESPAVVRSDESSNGLPASTSFTLDLNVSANTVYLGRPTCFADKPCDDVESTTATTEACFGSALVVRTPEQREIAPADGWHNAVNLRSENDERRTYEVLAETYKQHKENLLQQLLSANGLSLHWNSVIASLADEIIDFIRPDMNHDATELDIRHYVQFKKVSGGLKTDSALIHGIVSSKNIAHKKMASTLENPRILLIAGSIVYHRTEGRFTTLEPVIMQETEYLRHVSARIINLQPNLVLVQHNVSRQAQDLLREQGVTLVLNVKERILQRLARCTNADVIASIASVDAYIGRPRLGTCKRFFLKTFEIERGGSKTLMFFEGLPMSYLGATVLLRGCSKLELVRLKKIAAFMLFACYNWRLEKSFLMDEMARPSNFRRHARFIIESSKETSPTQCTDKDVDADATFALASGTLLKQSKENMLKQLSDSSENDTSLFTNSVNKNRTSPAKFDEEKKIVTGVQGFSDPLQCDSEGDVIVRHGNDHLAVAESPFPNRFRGILDDTMLSISPYLSFAVPFLESEVGRKCRLRNFFPSQVYYSERLANKVRPRSFKDSEWSECNERRCPNSQLKPVHEFLTTQIAGNANSAEVQTLLAHFRACGGRYVKRAISQTVDAADNGGQKHLKQCQQGPIDALDPTNHQRLAVLFCSFSALSTNAPTYCVNPWVIYMDFYNRDDIPLGCFLERYCFSPEYRCQSRLCDTPMLDHVRRFAHGIGCVSLSLNTYPNNPQQEDESYEPESSYASESRRPRPIVMWSWCTKCHKVSPVVPVTIDTWSFSFAKYLQLRFQAGSYGRRDDGGGCNHSLHHDHDQYFGSGKTVACFRYTSIQLWEISLPPPLIAFNYDITSAQSLLIEEIKSVTVKNHETFALISDKLALLPDIEEILNWRRVLAKEEAQFKIRIEELQIKLSTVTVENAEVNVQHEKMEIMRKVSQFIIHLKQMLIEMVDKWNSRLVEISKIRDVELKKSKNQPHDLESSVGSTESQTLLTELEGASDNTSEASVQLGLSKKIRSLDQSDDDRTPIPSPRAHHRSQSDGTVLTQLEEMSADIFRKEDKKSMKHIFSQLLASTTAFAAIPAPFPASSHFCLAPGLFGTIAVHETELSSVIAYALNSHGYRCDYEERVCPKSAPTAVNEPSPSPLLKRRNVQEGVESTSTMDLETLSSSKSSEDKDSSPSKRGGGARTGHIEVHFEDSTCNFFCRAYCAVEFAQLRQLALGMTEEEFIHSLSRCVAWNARGGKSGSHFSKTLDERFILKDMQKNEVQLFLEWAPNYFAYMERSLASGLPTLLGKILGIYHVIYRNSATNANLRTNVLVMENLFYQRNVSQKFDLKGSMRNRLVNPTNSDNQDGEIVLLDENFVKKTCECPLYILPHSKEVLTAAIQSDTEFLVGQSVMDYSLLVGLDNNRKELVLGIIDYIRTFTWDKKLETIVKKYGNLGKGKQPTIISPDEYRNRFIDAMHHYFLEVPDTWAGLGKGLD